MDEAPATTRVASALYNEVPLKRTRPAPAIWGTMAAQDE